MSPPLPLLGVDQPYQASHDFTVYAATATAAGLSGVLQAQAGRSVINLAGLPLMAIVISVAVWVMVWQRELRALPTQ